MKYEANGRIRNLPDLRHYDLGSRIMKLPYNGNTLICVIEPHESSTFLNDAEVAGFETRFRRGKVRTVPLNHQNEEHLKGLIRAQSGELILNVRYWF